MNKEITQIQIAWFFSDTYKGNFEEFSLRLKNNLGESKLTQLLPIPNDMPNEIPRLVLTYEAFNLNVAKNRLDIFFKDFSMIEEKTSKITKIILEDFKLKVGRIGFVKTIYLEGNIENLKEILSKERIALLDIKEINIRINTKKTINGRECNNIENISNGFLIKKDLQGEKRIAGLILIRDINTISEKLDELLFDQKTIGELLFEFNKESDSSILIR